jgi:nucleoside-diphosphate-sugar epimerase
VFVTGATGYLGGAIAARLARSGYEVRGLVRDLGRASTIAAAGVEPVVGDLGALEGLLAELETGDAVVHAAYDASDPPRLDQRALEAFRTAAQEGRIRRLLYTSGIWVHGDTGGRVVDESSPLDPAQTVRWRPAHEEIALGLASQGVQALVLRPAMVYGRAGGTLGDWFREACEKGTVHYPGDGRQRWGMVHVDDVAEAYRLAFEQGPRDERYLLADESRFTVRELAEAAARAAGARAQSVDATEVRRTLAGTAQLMDQQFSAAKARRELGWAPRHTSFVDEAETLYREWLACRGATVQ